MKSKWFTIFINLNKMKPKISFCNHLYKRFDINDIMMTMLIDDDDDDIGQQRR